MLCHLHANVMMMKTQQLSIDLRQKIIDLHDAGNGYGEISKRLNISKSTIRFVLKNFAQFGTSETLPGRGKCHALYL